MSAGRLHAEMAWLVVTLWGRSGGSSIGRSWARQAHDREAPYDLMPKGSIHGDTG